MPKQKPSGGHPIVAILATFLVVGGIVAVSYFSSHPSNPAPKVQNTSASTTSTEPTEGPELWLVNQESVTVAAGGKMERMTKDVFEHNYAGIARPYDGSDVANGTKTYFKLDDTAGQKILNQDGKISASLGQPKSDGAQTLEFAQEGRDPWSSVLRDKSGKPLNDASLLGWLDARTVAFTAQASTTRAVYVMGLEGGPRILSALPDYILYLEVRDGSVWYTTAVIGEGLESAPQGPSELHRIKASGEDTKLVREEAQVVLSALPGPASSFVYRLDNGQAYYRKDASAEAKNLGKFVPLVFTDSEHLAYRDNFNLKLVDLVSGETKDLGSLPEGQVSIFVAPSTAAPLDGIVF